MRIYKPDNDYYDFIVEDKLGKSRKKKKYFKYTMDKSTYMQELAKCRQNYDELFGKLRLSKNQQINFSYSWWESELDIIDMNKIWWDLLSLSRIKITKKIHNHYWFSLIKMLWATISPTRSLIPFDTSWLMISSSDSESMSSLYGNNWSWYMEFEFFHHGCWPVHFILAIARYLIYFFCFWITM